MKVAREKHQGRPITLTADSSAESLKARKAWNYAVQVLKTTYITIPRETNFNN